MYLHTTHYHRNRLELRFAFNQCAVAHPQHRQIDQIKMITSERNTLSFIRMEMHDDNGNNVTLTCFKWHLHEYSIRMNTV